MSPTLRRAVPLLVAAAVLGILAVVLGASRMWDDPASDSSTVGSPGTSGSSGSSGTATDDGGGTSGSTGTAGTSPPADPSTEPGPDEPASRFIEVSPGADGASLDVTFWGGVDTCYRYTVAAEESSKVVSLSLSEERRTDGPCIDLAQEYHRTVPLDASLDDRPVRDAATGEVVLDPQG